jgi:phosphatidylinositol alpha-1,6-mannosyltransferase
VLDGSTGYVVPGRDQDALVARLVALLRDEGLARRMGEAGRAWVLEQWQWRTKADQLRALLAGQG